MIRTLILDFDGTMADTRGIIVRTLHQTIEALGAKQPSDDECAATIGLPLATAFCQLLGVESGVGEQCAQVYRKLFVQNNSATAVPLFPHVADTIRLLAVDGLTITIASSRGHESLREFVERFRLDAYISLIIGAEDVKRAKPDPEPVLTTLQALHAEAAEALVVGDTAFDIEMGKRAGAHTCAVTYGNGTRTQLMQSGAQHIIDDFARLPQVIALFG